jgi:hypothetical protein
MITPVPAAPMVQLWRLCSLSACLSRCPYCCIGRRLFGLCARVAGRCSIGSMPADCHHACSLPARWISRRRTRQSGPVSSVAGIASWCARLRLLALPRLAQIAMRLNWVETPLLSGAREVPLSLSVRSWVSLFMTHTPHGRRARHPPRFPRAEGESF